MERQDLAADRFGELVEPGDQAKMERAGQKLLGLLGVEPFEVDELIGEDTAIVVAGGYYIHPEVRECLGYTGQEPSVVRVDVVPEYVEEGLLERVIARGQIFRDDG